MFTIRREASFLCPPPHTALPQTWSDSHSSCCWPFFVVVASIIAVPCADIACSLYVSTGSVFLLPPQLLFVLSLDYCRRRCYCACCHCYQAAITMMFLLHKEGASLLCVLLSARLRSSVTKWQLYLGTSKYGLMVPSPPCNSCICSLTPEKGPMSFSMGPYFLFSWGTSP